MKKYLVIGLFLWFSFVSVWAQPSGKTYTIAANPKAGFSWGYLLYIPDTVDKTKKLPILFTMNDSGIFESVAELEQATRERFGRGNEDYIAYEVGVPMVLPLVLREKGKIDAHDLNRAAFLVQQGPYKRLDKQVIAMLEDARKQLKKEGIRTQKKFLAAGFSSAGAFGWKLALLHPKKILAVAVGGEMYPALPVKVFKGKKLLFPVGVGDVKEITGRDFNEKAWRRIPILLTNGAYDYNDPLNSLFGQEDGDLVIYVFGRGTLQTRWETARSLLAQLAPNVQTHTYPKTEHEPIQQDIIAFLKMHLQGGPLRPLTLTDTAGNPAWLPLQVSQLYWGRQTPLTHDKEYLRDTDLMLQVPGDHMPFWVRFAVAVDIIQNGEVVLSGLPVRGFFEEENGFFLQVPVDAEEAKELKTKSSSVFQVRSALPEVLHIPAELTVQIK